MSKPKPRKIIDKITASKIIYMPVVVVIVASIIIGGIYYYEKPVETDKTISSMSLVVTYKDGTTKIFDSKTLQPGALYLSGSSTPIKSISATVYVTPTLSGALPAGWSVKTSTKNWYPQAFIHDPAGGNWVSGETGFASLWTTVPVGTSLTPNVKNVMAQATINEEWLNRVIPVGTTQEIYFGVINPVTISLHDASGTAKQTMESAFPAPITGAPTDKVLAKINLKRSSDTVTPSITITSVSLGGTLD